MPRKPDHCTGVPNIAVACCDQHDVDYRGQTVSRAEADRRFRQCLLDMAKDDERIWGSLFWTPLAWAAWLGVRALGWIWFGRKDDPPQDEGRPEDDGGPIPVFPPHYYDDPVAPDPLSAVVQLGPNMTADLGSDGALLVTIDTAAGGDLLVHARMMQAHLERRPIDLTLRGLVPELPELVRRVEVQATEISSDDFTVFACQTVEVPCAPA